LPGSIRKEYGTVTEELVDDGPEENLGSALPLQASIPADSARRGWSNCLLVVILIAVVVCAATAIGIYVVGEDIRDFINPNISS